MRATGASLREISADIAVDSATIGRALKAVPDLTTGAAPVRQVLSTALTAHIAGHRPPTPGRHSTHPRPTRIPTLLRLSCPAWSVVRW
jgi:hypothetical protein